MSSYRTKKKRRRAKLNRWKKREKKRSRHSHFMRMIDELEHASILSNYANVIITEYTLGEKDGFRWVHDPVEDIDSLPQKFQNPDFREEDIVLPPQNATEDAIKEFVNSDNFTLSQFETFEQAEAAYISALKGRLDNIKGKTERLKEAKKRKVIEKFKKKKGSYIRKVHYRYNALIGKTNENGHFNILPRKGLTINDVIDDSFEPRKIDINYE